MACISCEQISRKYKCIKCTAPYCSLNCYKLHKDSVKCSELAATLLETQLDKGQLEQTEEPTVYAPFSTEDTLTQAELRQLSQHDPLRQLLYNPHLRALLQQIDTAHNVELTMVAAMQEPLFVEFANACLQVLEPPTTAERAELELINY